LLSHLVVLPAGAEDACAHICRRSHLQMESTGFHCLVPIDSIHRPLIVDSSEESTLTLIPFIGKGLDQALEEGQNKEQIEMFDWDDLDDVVQ
jgi:hypothetical protein